MRVCLRLWLMLALLVSVGCSQLLQFTEKPEQRLQRLVAEHRYESALALVDGLDAASPGAEQLIAQRPQLVVSLAAYEKALVQESLQFQWQYQWSQAELLLADGLERNPGSEAIKKRQSVLLAKRDTFVHRKQALLDIELSQSLPKFRAYTEQLLLAYPQRADLLEEKKYVDVLSRGARIRLTNNAEAYVAEENWTLAEKMLSAAKRLGQTDRIVVLDRKISSHKQVQLLRQQRASEQQQQSFKRGQMAALERALSQSRWREASSIAGTLAPWRGQDKDVEAKISELEQKLQQRVQELTERGQSHYTHGALDDAISDWQQALQLAPDSSDLKERLVRARRFKANYEKLQ